MKKLFIATVLIILVSCGTGNPKPGPGSSTWGNAKWDSSMWEK
jgi:hypothetical protein